MEESKLLKIKKILDYIILNRCSLSKAAKEFKISQGTISNYVHKIAKEHFQDEYNQILEIIKPKELLIDKISPIYLGHELLNGHSLKSLSKVYNCHIDTVKSRLDKIEDLELKKQVEEKIKENTSELKGKFSNSKDRSVSVIIRVGNGEKLSEIAKEMGVTKSTLAHSVKTNKEKIRNINTNQYDLTMMGNLAKSNLFETRIGTVKNKAEYIRMIAEYMIVHQIDIVKLSRILERDYMEVYNLLINELPGYDPYLYRKVLETIENNKSINFKK